MALSNPMRIQLYACLFVSTIFMAPTLTQAQVRYTEAQTPHETFPHSDIVRRELVREFGLTALDIRLRSVRDAHGTRVYRFDRFEGGMLVRNAELMVRYVERANGASSTRDLVFQRCDGNRVDTHNESVRARLPSDAVPAFLRRATATGYEVIPTYEYIVRNMLRLSAIQMIVDARDGTAIFGHELVEFETGRIYPHDQTERTTVITLPNVTSRTSLSGDDVRTASGILAADQSSIMRMPYAMPNASGVYDFQPVPATSPVLARIRDPFAEVNVYAHIARFASRLRCEHGYRWVCTGNNTGATDHQIDTAVNVAVAAGGGNYQGFENAAYIPAQAFGNRCGQMAFGEGSLFDFGYDSDIIFHEYGHSVMRQLVDPDPAEQDQWGVRFTPGAINEGQSDYWAASMNNDPVTAETLAAIGAVPRRTDLELDARSNQTGEDHEDGRVWSTTLWEIRQALGRARADRIIYTTEAALPRSVNFLDAARVLLQTARSIANSSTNEVIVVQRAIARTHLAEWEPIVQLLTTQKRLGYLAPALALQGGGNLPGIGPLEYRTTVAADRSAWITVRATDQFEHPTSARFQARISNQRIARTALPATAVMITNTAVFNANRTTNYDPGTTISILFENLASAASATSAERGDSFFEIGACNSEATCPTSVIRAVARTDQPTIANDDVCIGTGLGQPDADAGAGVDASVRNDASTAGTADGGTTNPPATGGCGCRVDSRSQLQNVALACLFMLALAGRVVRALVRR